MKTLLIIQARTSSSRFPRKMFAEIGGMPLFEFVYRRCLLAETIDPPRRVVLATSDDPSDDKLAMSAIKKGFEVFRGSLNDVLNRFIACAEKYKADEIIRLCGDSPLVDVDLMNRLCKIRRAENLDYAAPRNGTFIPAFDSEVITLEALKKVDKNTKKAEDHEHVTLFIRKNPESFNCCFFDAGLMRSGLEKIHLTVDYEKDLELNNMIFKKLPEKYKKDLNFTSKMILDILENSMP